MILDKNTRQKQCKIESASALFIGNKVNSKYNYYEVFLVYFLLSLKKHDISFYQPHCITMLKYDSFRPALKYNLFTRHPNYYKKFLHFVFFRQV